MSPPGSTPFQDSHLLWCTSPGASIQQIFCLACASRRATRPRPCAILLVRWIYSTWLRIHAAQGRLSNTWAWVRRVHTFSTGTLLCQWSLPFPGTALWLPFRFRLSSIGPFRQSWVSPATRGSACWPKLPVARRDEVLLDTTLSPLTSRDLASCPRVRWVHFEYSGADCSQNIPP